MNARFLAFFILKRLIALVILLVIMSFGIFSLLYLAPGSVEETLLGTRQATPDVIKALRNEYHLNDPFLVQYGIWAKGALHLDFGRSIATLEPVLDAIKNRAGVTMFLGAYGFIVAMISGILLGIVAALRKRSFIDRSIVVMSVFGVSAPAFATGIFLLYVFAVLFGWFPVFGAGTGFTDRLYHLTLPAIALAMTGAALVLKLTRTAMIQALDQDYVAFARARGLSRSRVIFAYALRNALVPVVTAGGLILAYMLTGAVLIEVTFALPGIGSLLVDAVNFKDVPMVQGLTMVIATTIILVNLLTDILYLFIDPRIRFGRDDS